MIRWLVSSLLIACAACGGKVVIDPAPQPPGGTGGLGGTSTSGSTGSTGSTGSSSSGAGGFGTGTCTLPGEGPLPALWYPLDGDATNHGAYGAPYDGVAVDVAWVAGKMGQGAEVGTGWIDLPKSAGLLKSPKGVTIALWVQPDLVEGGQPFLDCRSPESGFHSYHGKTAGTLITTCSDGGCDSFQLPDTGWHHILYRYSSTEVGGSAPLEIFVDGNYAVTPTTDYPLFFSQVVDIALGRDHLELDWVPSHHRVDDVRVYEEVFTDAEQCTQIVGGAWCDGTCQLP